MSKQLHKNFIDKQVKLLLKSYVDKEIKINYILSIPGTKRRKYFKLIDIHAFTGVVLTLTDYRLSLLSGNWLSSPPLQIGSSR